MTRRRRILAAALMFVLATCVDHRAPTSSETEAVAEQPVALTTATITHTLLTAGRDPANTKVYTTASIAPAPNALITVAVLTHRSSGAAPEPSLSGGGMSSWDVVATTTFNGATPMDRVTILRALSSSPGSGPITITMSATVSNCQWIVSQWDGVETSGANGAGAIAQSDVTSGTGVTGLAVTLASFAGAGNVGFGVFGLASATPAATAGSGFTRIDEQPSGESTTGDLFAEWAPGQNVIDASWSSLSAGALGVELVAGGGGGGGSGVSAAKSTVVAAPTSISADGTTSTITVTALDANDAPLSGLAVVLTVSGTGNTVSAIGPTDANGQATATLSSTVAEQKTVSAKIDGTSITQTATVTVTPGAVDKDQSTVAAAPSTIAPGSGVATITVTAKDAQGNPIENATVELLTTGSANLTQPANPTDAKGEATGTLSSTVEEAVTVSAKIAGTTVTQTAIVTVATQTTAEITQTLLTSGSDPTNQKVYTTAAVAPAPNALITIAVLMRRSSGAVSPTIAGGGMSSWDQVASVNFDTPASPTKRLLVFRAMSASPGSGPVTITFPSSVSNCEWIVSQWDGVDASGANGAGAIAQIDSATSDAASGLTVTLGAFASPNDVAYGVVGVAQNGPTVNPGTGFTEIAEESPGESVAEQAEWAANQPTVAESWNGSTKAGMLAIELKAGSGGGGGSGVSATKSTVAAAPASISADGTTSTITVTALDANDAPLSGLAVVLTVSGTGNTVSAIGPTDANGQAMATLSSTVAESKTVSAKIDGTPITQTVTVTVTPGAVDKDQSTVAAAPSTIAPGSGIATITVTAKDAHGNPIQNATVELLTTGSANLTQPANPTDAKGEATGTLSSTVEEAVTVSAKIAGTTITQTAPVTVMSVAVSVDLSTLVASPTTIDPGFGDATITVTAKDASGNPISGANVQLLTTGSAVLTQPANPTDGSGVATGTVYSSIEETVTISAKINGFLITQTATVQITTHPEESIVQTLLTSGHDVVNQKVYTTAVIAPAPNALVTIAVLMRRSSGALSPTVSGGGMPAWEQVASVDFDTQGVPTKRLLIFRALSPTPGNGAVTITFASSVSNCQWIVSQWLGVDASGTNGSGAIAQAGQAASDGATTLGVSLAAFADPGDLTYGVTGVAVNGPAVNPATGFTEIGEESSEEASALEAAWATNLTLVGASWSPSTKAGMLAVEIRAGTAGPVEPVATVEVSPPSASVVVSGTVQLTASTLDIGGEPLYGRPVTWGSDAPGIASVSSTGLVTGIAVGSTTIRATSEGQTGTASVTVTSTAATVASVEVTPASTSIPVGGTVLLTATPKDAQGQPLTGRTITWQTDAPSIATVSSTGLVTGQATGSAVITATSEGQSGASSVTVTSGGTAALVGQWSAVMPAPIVEVHQHLLLDGKVLTFGENGPPQVFDPATGIFTPVPSPSLLFCGGHDFLPDGRLLVTGGGTGNGKGLPNTNIFDPASDAWVVLPNMAQGRWYPTNTMLPDGRMITVAGQDENGTAEPIPEIWDGTSWNQLTGANLTLPNYPRDFVAPDGRIFDAGPSATSHWLTLSGGGSWTDGPRMNFGSRNYGSAVMYDVGKILYAGGNATPTNTAEIIDLNQANPQWSYTGSMALSRWNLNATVLPDGQVLVTGGVNGDRSNPTLAVDVAEMWNPATGLWTTMATAASLLRGYHSTSLLLPDGRVIHSGGGDGGGTVDNFNYQIYSPPYLFKGARPSVTGVVGTPAYGQSLTVQTPDGAGITKVTLIRFGSVTHAFDQGQRLVSLSFSPVSGGVSVTLPSSRMVAPPGPYMLFLVNGSGVPSVGQIIRLQ